MEQNKEKTNLSQGRSFHFGNASVSRAETWAKVHRLHCLAEVLPSDRSLSWVKLKTEHLFRRCRWEREGGRSQGLDFLRADRGWLLTLHTGPKLAS